MPTIRQTIRHFHSADLLALFSPQNRISRRLGHTMGRDDGVKFAAGERALLRGSYECGPCWRHVLWLWHIATASLLSFDLTHHPQLLIRSHNSPLGWITERKSARTLYFKTVNPLSLHPSPVHKQLFWKRSSSRQLNPIHLRHEMPQAALSDWQETQWFPS